MAEKTHHRPDIQTHLISSSHIDDIVEVHVMQPVMKIDASERFQVLYVTDANMFWDAASGITRMLQFMDYWPRFIVVGVGYPGSIDTSGWSTRRYRDFFSFAPDQEHPKQDIRKIVDDMTSTIEGGDPPQVSNLGCGASDFLDFLQEELIPFVDENYPTIAGQRGYFGYSGGCRFAHYVLFHRPDTFNKYVIGSGGMYHAGEPTGFVQARTFIESGRAIEAEVFLSVGGEEQFEPPLAGKLMGTSFYELSRMLLDAKVAGLKLTTRLYPGEGHATCGIRLFVDGVSALYGPGEKEMGWAR